jgi:RNA polymerase sigma factor (sigma-70 family)
MIADEARLGGREEIRHRYDQAYETNWALLRGRALAVTRDGAAADDVAQEAFERLWSRSRGGWWPDNAGGWLSRVATNIAVSLLRRDVVASRGLAAIRQGRSFSHHESSAEDTWLGREDARVAMRAWRALSPDAREAVRLAGLGYSRAAIAERLGRTELATRTLICRSRSTLRVRSGRAPAWRSAATSPLSSERTADIADLDTAGHIMAGFVRAELAGTGCVPDPEARNVRWRRAPWSPQRIAAAFLGRALGWRATFELPATAG